MSTYYIFKTSNTNLSSDANIIRELNVTLTAKQSARLFGTESLADRPITLCEIKPTKDDLTPAFINNHYYPDCNQEITELLSKNKNLIGFSSYHMNAIFKEIIKVNESGIPSLLGENSWPDLKTLFSTLNKLNTNYVVLRKYETLPDSFLDGDHDIDILCDSLKEVVLITGATKRNIGISSYQLIINGEKTDFDIRFVGDNYIDPTWARIILNSSHLNGKNISIMDDENQLFSILYHCLTQKKSISNYYSNEIAKLSSEIFGEKFILSSNSLLKKLAYYMKYHTYTCPKPSDTSVVQNKDNIKEIKAILSSTSKKTEFLRSLYIKAPNKIRKKLPYSKEFYKN